VGVLTLGYVALAIFERLAPRPLLRAYWKMVNPLVRPLAGFVPGWAILETTGRRTGRAHRVPVGGRRRRDSFWCLAGHGRKADYVLNIEANPRVRVRTHGRWRRGTAHVLTDDDPRRRLFRLNPANGIFILLAGSDVMTVRIDLEPR
jgi:deazaflavin-dependent oxidoreductase (nitroreductase family)